MSIQSGTDKLVGSVTGALIAGKHLANQEKNNELNYISQSNNLKLNISDAEREAENLHFKGLINDHDIDYTNFEAEKQLKLNDIAKGKADSTEPGSAENKEALNELTAIGVAMDKLHEKSMAQAITRDNIKTQYEKVQQIKAMKENELNVLNKANPKLAKKYGGIK